MTRRLVVILIGAIMVSALGAGVYYSVKWAYGGFGDYYYLTARLDRAGQQMETGLDVRIRGVKVGTVSGIELVDREAELTLQIEQKYEVPEDATGVVSLKTPLGSKYVDLQFDPTSGAAPLQDGDSLASARVGPELEDLLDDGVGVLEAIDPDDIATILAELSDASDGRGDTIAEGIEANADLSDLFASTLDPQLQALDDFETIFGALEEVGVDLNELAAAVNEGAPVYASAEAQQNLRTALETVVPFADNFADLLILNRDDWDRMIDNGDIVLGTIAAHPQGLHDLVHGLYRYVYKLGGEIDPFFQVEDGSAGAGFTAFIGGNDQEEEEKQICEVFPEPVHDEIPVCEGSR
jgi:phospholipid/cholesterol/gamma-HCH transport system substrate-binding protein